MMFAGQNHAAHISRGERLHNRIGIEVNRLKKIRIFIAIAPLFIRECVDSEMKKSRSLQRMPGQLTR